MGTSFVAQCTPEQIAHLAEILHGRGWEFSSLAYAHWKAAGNRVNVAAYLSGKVTVQGANTDEFVLYTLEPEILKTFTYGTETEKLPPDTSPHGGIDESGKGDFFGPLVIAGVYVNADTAPKLADAGVCDSKKISSGNRIRQLAGIIRKITGPANTVVAISPETYNRMYSQIGNLNRLLAWGHARVIENLLTQVPDCPRMLSDKFAADHLIKNALMERGRRIKLEQQTKAESDAAVAAASILARERFIDCMDKLSAETGTALPKGVSNAVKETARRIFQEQGKEGLARCAKTHFRTFEEVTS